MVGAALFVVWGLVLWFRGLLTTVPAVLLAGFALVALYLDVLLARIDTMRGLAIAASDLNADKLDRIGDIKLERIANALAPLERTSRGERLMEQVRDSAAYVAQTLQFQRDQITKERDARQALEKAAQDYRAWVSLMMDGSSDAEEFRALLRRAGAGDEDAMGELVRGFMTPAGGFVIHKRDLG